LVCAASTALLLEYEAVALRREHQLASGMTREEILVILDALAAMMVEAPIYWRLRPLSPDPGDDLVLEAAWNASADVLVTTNARDLEKPCAKLGIRMMGPSMLLMELAREQ
jgi:predicted nucleic acid-binding protein